MAAFTPFGNFGTGTLDQGLQDLVRGQPAAQQHALLGQIAFSLITYFEGIDIRFGAQYAEHALLQGKPRLQWTGDMLEEYTWTLVFHSGFCTPELELAKLRAAISAHEALPLVFANGDYRGRFVPVWAEVSTRQTGRDGTALCIEVRVTLREFVEPPVIPEETPKQKPVAAEKADSGGKKKKPAGTVRRKATPRPPGGDRGTRGGA